MSIQAFGIVHIETGKLDGKVYRRLSDAKNAVTQRRPYYGRRDPGKHPATHKVIRFTAWADVD